jgi:hypothetical protein
VAGIDIDVEIDVDTGLDTGIDMSILVSPSRYDGTLNNARFAPASRSVCHPPEKSLHNAGMSEACNHLSK